MGIYILYEPLSDDFEEFVELMSASRISEMPER